jgi:hypothetical protein
MLDNITFVPPETPSLMTMLSMGNDSLNPAVYGPQTAAKILDKFDVVNLLLINFDGEDDLSDERFEKRSEVELPVVFSSERTPVPLARTHLPDYSSCVFVSLSGKVVEI